MIRETLAERLDQEIEAIRAGANPSRRPELGPLLEVAASFQLLADPEFRLELKAELLAHAESARFAGKIDRLRAEGQAELSPAPPAWAQSGCDRGSVRAEEIAGVLSLPSLAHRELSALPADPRSLLLSFVSHAALVAAISIGLCVSTGVV